jgi:hypothetical protein
MKKIELDIIQEKAEKSAFINRNKHTIYLDHGMVVRFDDLRKAKSYQHQLNIWLNTTMFELNGIYAQILYLKQFLWHFTTLDLDVSLKGSAQMIDQLLSQAYHGTRRGASSSFYVNRAITQLIRELNKILDSLLKLMKYRGDTARIYEIGVYKVQLNRIMAEYLITIEPGEDGELTIRKD